MQSGRLLRGYRLLTTHLTENGIVGEALIALTHDELKEMGINSVGHRLTILKQVYEIKIHQKIPIDPDHYHPICMSPVVVYRPPTNPMFAAAEQSTSETATQEDLTRLIESIQMRDEKLMFLETELRRFTKDYSSLRKELEDVKKLLPPPSVSLDRNGSLSTPNNTSPGLSGENPPSSKFARAFTKRMQPSSTKHSPTLPPPTISEGRNYHDTLNLSSSHLAPSLNGGAQLSPGIPSPTSPHTHHSHPQTLNSRSYTQPGTGSKPSTPYDYSEKTPTTNSRDRLTPSQISYRADTPSSTSRFDPRADPRAESRSESRASGSENPNSVEIFKSFRVSWEDPCDKVLPAALKKYKINADSKNYALYIVYGDQERCLESKEKPLLLFKQLEKEGKKPMFMLRKIHMDTPGLGSSAPNSAGFDGGRQGQINLPGGVL